MFHHSDNFKSQVHKTAVRSKKLKQRMPDECLVRFKSRMPDNDKSVATAVRFSHAVRSGLATHNKRQQQRVDA